MKISNLPRVLPIKPAVVVELVPVAEGGKPGSREFRLRDPVKAIEGPDKMKLVQTRRNH